MDVDGLLDSFAVFEWEPGAHPLDLAITRTDGDAPSGVKKVRVSRDENYQLVGQFEGISDPMEPPAGSSHEWRPLTRFALEAEAGFHTTYRLDGCVVLSRQRTLSFRDGEVGELRGKIRIGSCTRVSSREEPANRLVEWFINGPGGWFMYPRSISRDATVRLERTRHGHNDANISEIWELEPKTTGEGWMKIQADGFWLSVSEVPDHFAPHWTKKVAIEYRTEWGQIPNEDERATIQAFLSFAFGRRLLKCGQTTFADEHTLLEAVATTVGGPTRYITSIPAYPPLPQSTPAESLETEQAIGNLLPQFLNEAEDLGITEALAYRWIAAMIPTGYSFPVFYAAIQGLVDRWVQRRASMGVTHLMDDQTFRSAVSSFIDSAVSRLPTEVQSQIKAHMLNANRRTQNQAWKAALDELALELTNAEQEALKRRHPFAHGRLVPLDNPGGLFELERAYISLLNRLVLRILGYSGTYLDHTPAAAAKKEM